MSHRIPPLESAGVWSVSATSTINASRDRVWKVLCDFKSYKEWNPFVRAQTVNDASHRPLPDEDLAEGNYLDISEVHLPPTMGTPGFFGKAASVEIITVVDPENYRLAWALQGMIPRFLLHSERWQVLTDLGNGQTQYYTFDVFTGALAYPLKLVYRSALQEGFQAMADTLKTRAEQQVSFRLYRSGSSIR